MSATDTDPSDSKKPVRAKWEQELEEILAASDRAATPVDKARGKVISARYQAPGQVMHTTTRIRSGMSTGIWLLVFLGLTVGAFAVRHFSPLLGRTMAVAAVVLLVIVVTKGLMASSRGDGGPKMWRGREVDPGPKNPSEQSWRSRLFDQDRDR
ncbi:hypothetical protein BH23CHL4_BH23CHL4_11630 [soil metagenome]